MKYLLIGDINFRDGVNKKILNQILELNKLGEDVELIWIGHGDIFYNYNFLKIYQLNYVPMKNFFRYHFKRAYVVRKILVDLMKSLSIYDIIYIRYPILFFYYPKNFLKRFRRCKIVTEHQTKELVEFKLVKNFIYYWSEYLFGKFLLKQSDAIVGVTDEITQYELKRCNDPNKPHITIANGIDVASVPLRHSPSPVNTDLQLLFVANISRWNGIDRLLRGLAEYNGSVNVTFHVAGDGGELQYLKKLVTELNLVDKVIFHGFTAGSALDALFDRCHVAVGSLGIHRVGLKEASILKAREYCARGIPWIIACGDPDFSDDFPYILRLPADESPINIDDVVEFAKRVCSDPEHPQKMRDYALEHLDWSVKMKKLKAFLESLVGESASIPQ